MSSDLSFNPIENTPVLLCLSFHLIKKSSGRWCERTMRSINLSLDIANSLQQILSNILQTINDRFIPTTLYFSIHNLTHVFQQDVSMCPPCLVI